MRAATQRVDLRSWATVNTGPFAFAPRKLTPLGVPEVEVPLRPQPGPQEKFLSATTDIAIMGGSVFGGKTWALTFEPLRHRDVPGFTFVSFRRTRPELTNLGGMWDEAREMYPRFGGVPKEGPLQYEFPSGARGKFAGLQYDNDVLAWKGAQICLLNFDQLEEFTERQFFYLLSRNRSQCGVRPYVRASCNASPDSFLRDFLRWWIDDETGYAIPERSGAVRWFIRIRDTLHWADTREDLIAEHGKEKAQYAKSVTFILARLQDNVIGNAKDPSYEANVRSLPLVDQERLLGGDKGGNWNIREAAGLVFSRAWLKPLAALPSSDIVKSARGWDKAGTSGGGDYTAGGKILKWNDAGVVKFVIADMVRGQWGAGDREKIIRSTAEADGHSTRIRLEQEPAAGGKESAEATIRNLAGFVVHAVPKSNGKVENANPLAAQAQAGNVYYLANQPWSEPLLRELHAFPTAGVPDDQVDALADAFNEIEGVKTGGVFFV